MRDTLKSLRLKVKAQLWLKWAWTITPAFWWGETLFRKLVLQPRRCFPSKGFDLVVFLVAKAANSLSATNSTYWFIKSRSYLAKQLSIGVKKYLVQFPQPRWRFSTWLGLVCSSNGRTTSMQSQLCKPSSLQINSLERLNRASSSLFQQENGVGTFNGGKGN